MKPTLEYEKKYWRKGKKYICGIDEVGRGCWAGPLYVGAVVFEENCEMIEGVNDSKKLTAKKREELHKKIINISRSYAIGVVLHSEIDKYGLTYATNLAMKRAIESLEVKADMLLTDSLKYEDIDVEPILNGDSVCYSIACASILAKVERDKHISSVPEAKKYRFDKNKGYGTAEHIELLKKHGISDIHRKSYKPIRVYL